MACYLNDPFLISAQCQCQCSPGHCECKVACQCMPGCCACPMPICRRRNQIGNLEDMIYGGVTNRHHPLQPVIPGIKAHPQLVQPVPCPRVASDKHALTRTPHFQVCTGTRPLSLSLPSRRLPKMRAGSCFYSKGFPSLMVLIVLFSGHRYGEGSVDSL